MAKEILYRRSFHCDRDLTSVKNLIELEKAAIGRKTNRDGWTFGDGGIEAPRNSLDVPVGGFMEMRRRSEVRCEDIPIGYELSRSLTTRRRNEDPIARKSMSSADSFLSKSKFLDKGNLDADQKPRASSVVARLMGLDPLPHQEDVQSLQISSHSSSRRLLPHEFFTPQSGSATASKHVGVLRVPSQRGATFMEESTPEKPSSHGELSFRNHPQEKQLQEFKKEFTVQQGKQLEPCSNTDMLGTVHERAFQKEKHGFNGEENLQESQEFLDALDFLHSNKDFFVKVLKDPSSMFGKGLQRRKSMSSAHHREGSGHRLTRTFSEARKESYICLPVAQASSATRRNHGDESDDIKAQSGSIPQFERDECMPAVQSRRHTHPVSPPLETGYEKTMPTKIVVLKPKLGKHARIQPSSPLSPSSRLDDGVNGVIDSQEIARHDTNEKLQGRHYAKENLNRRFPKDGSSDAAGEIARQIVKQVKEDLSRRLSSEDPQSLESASLLRSSSRGRRLTAKKIGVFVDAPEASDGEEYCSSSRRRARDKRKANASLPSSPRLARTNSQSEYTPSVNGNRRKGVLAEKSPRLSISAINTTEARKDHMGVGAFPHVGKKRDSIGNSRFLSNAKAGVSKDSKGTNESAKVLPRSSSAVPASASVENRVLELEQKGGSSLTQSPCLNTARGAQNSLFKGRLLSLKDSLSLNRKKSGRQQTNYSPSESSELSSPRQLNEEQGGTSVIDAQESSNDASPIHSRQATCSMQDAQDKAVMEGCLDYLMSVNSMKAREQHQWTSTGDILDTSSDGSLEKCEQPSPVSVLDPPFQEESPSPEQAITDCTGASLQLSPLESDYKKLLINLHEELLSSPVSHQRPFNSNAEEAPRECNGAKLPLETWSVGDIACPLGADEEFVYIRDLLAFAGFSDNEVVMRAHSFSVQHGLNSSVFARLETHYENIILSKLNTASYRHNGCSIMPPLDALSRRMLYNVTDETLARKLIEPIFQLGLRQTMHCGSLLCTGKQLLEQVWAHISYYRHVPCESEEDSIDNLASRELMQDAGWSLLQGDMQAVTELERLICSDLIREVVHECVRV